ncbi:MAG: PEP/pyruvate-binding domain-containing protein [Candidatus Cloacimonadales bacterium]|nr:PEP/pyruvate-binding domain-containing protein [Candidatus Cloacimonadales bacterium]
MKGGTSFNRDEGFFNESFSYIGSGLPGGKASGLALMQEIIQKHFPDGNVEGMQINIPGMTVLLSSVFDEFMKNNSLYEFALSNASDDDIAIRFVNSSLGGVYAGDLYYLVENIEQPLAIRSSSICEDSLHEPFAGVYETKMVANNQSDKTERFNALINAIKYVYASLFFVESKEYFRSINRDIRDEKMAVIIQEVVGEKHDDLYFPTISGVLKSYNFYPADNIKPETGFAALAFGLGKTIVNGESCWSYCPKYPKTPQPFNNIKDMLDNTQKTFWAVNLAKIDDYNPIAETEYLAQKSIFDVDRNALQQVCSTYNFQNDRVITGLYGDGAPLLNFAPILKAETLPLNKAIERIMQVCETETASKVEIEFAVALSQDKAQLPRFGFLQLRPIAVSNAVVDLPQQEEIEDKLLLTSNNVMGNGISNEIFDIVFIRPETFDVSHTQQIAADIAELNALLVQNKRKYLLIGFGRWGTSDPWCGIPVKWFQISNAKIIVETVLPSMRADFSQGAHFFHNMTAHHVFYFSVNEENAKNLDWNWLQEQKIVNETRYVKHVRIENNLKVFVDGRKSAGVILK